MKQGILFVFAGLCVAIGGTLLAGAPTEEKASVKPAANLPVVAKTKKSAMKVDAVNSDNNESKEPSALSLPSSALNALRDSSNTTLKALAEDSTVVSILDPAKSNLMLWLPQADAATKEATQAAAEKLVTAVSKCLASGAGCGTDVSKWPEYFSTGSAPIMEPLEQGLQILTVLEETGSRVDIPVETLAAAQKVPQHNISVLASKLRVDRIQGRSDLDAALQSVSATQEKARAIYLKLLANKVEEFGSDQFRSQFVAQIQSSLQLKNPLTEDEVLQNIGDFRLQEDELVPLLSQACSGSKNSLRRRVFIDRKAAELGLAVNVQDICK